MRKVGTLLSLCLLVCNLSIAQKTAIYDATVAKYEEALMLYESAMYGAARERFAELRSTAETELIDGQIGEDAAFFEAMAAKMLANADAPRLLEDYQHLNQQNVNRDRAFYHLGDYYLNRGNEKKALEWLDKAEEANMPAKERTELLFKRGYCYFMRGEHNLALAQFDKFKGREGEYANAVKYYRAHVAYENGNLDEALKSFVELEKDDGFKKAAAYYIADIVYLQGHYEEALRYAEPLANQDGPRRWEMMRVVADSHFMLGEYKDAITAYNKLMDGNEKGVIRADFYHLGMAYVQTSDVKRAISNLSKVTSEADEIAQNAYYHLASCYIKQNDKKRARTAFEAAARYGFDAAITEDAHFNKLKLAYELNFSPFDELISSFIDFVELYPASPHKDEAYDLMGKALVSSKNYKKALQALEKVQHKDRALYKALQRISFYRGLELFNDGNYNDAEEFFVYSLKYGDHDQKLKARTYYWQAEGLYNAKQISPARDKYLMFINAYNASEVPEFATAHYNVGYTYFNQKDYTNARRWFQRYISLSGKKLASVEADAYNRIGDCLYVERAFGDAISYYDKAIETSPAQGDYSMLQRAICLGLQNNHNGKIGQLDDLVAKYPKSIYVAHAYFEKARAYVAAGDLKNGIYNYKVVKEKYPKSTLAPQAMLQLGLLYYNNSEFDNSMAFYKRVVNEYPSTPFASDALAGLRNVYMERGDYDGYIAYTSTLGAFAHVDMNERDSLLFVSASHLYLNGQQTEAKAALRRYLETFPDGRHVTPANYYLAECCYAAGENDEAQKLYMQVASQPRSIFTEESLLRSGELLYRSDNFGMAAEYFRRLEDEAEVETNKIEAIIGQMRCQRKLGDKEGCVSGADKVLSVPQATPEIRREAQYLKAKSLLDLRREQEALPVLKELSANTKTVEGAEAKYLVAQLLYDDGRKADAETEIFDYVENGTPHQYWLARSFILLSDIYRDKGEDFQSQQYLQLLKDSYTGEDDIAERIAERIKTTTEATENKGTSSLPE